MSIKTSFEARYPWLGQDVFSENTCREVVARHLDSFLHCLSSLPGSERVTSRLRAIQTDVFQLLVRLRRPTDQTRYSG